MRRWFTVLVAAMTALTGAAQEYGVVDISVCNLRATPDYDAEMVSQALLGTPVHIRQITDKNGWPEVQTPDTYTGWIHKDAVTRHAPLLRGIPRLERRAEDHRDGADGPCL